MTGDDAPTRGRERSTGTRDGASAKGGDASPTVRVDASEPAPFRQTDGAGLREGSLVGRYVVVERLGEGGMGVVARALGLARVALARGRPTDAVALAERAVKLREDGSAPAGDLAEARFVLAGALWDASRERSRALALAEQAREGYREAGDGKPTALAEVEAWLHAHRGAR